MQMWRGHWPEVHYVPPVRSPDDPSGAGGCTTGVAIKAEPGAWAYVLLGASRSPGILFMALSQDQMLCAELRGGKLEVRNYRLR